MFELTDLTDRRPDLTTAHRDRQDGRSVATPRVAHSPHIDRPLSQSGEPTQKPLLMK